MIIEFPFGLIVDLSFWDWWLYSIDSTEKIKTLFVLGGWTVLALIFFWMGSEFLVALRSGRYTKKWQWTLLAVDIPPLAIQSPKAIEQIFAHLSGAQTSVNVGQKYWMGKKQKWFSFEIISLEGYIQFIVRTEMEFRDLIEAAIYAQYPEAEITEVEDYVGLAPDHFPSETQDIFGVEFALENKDAYPIRTYAEFEINLTPDITFADPMAAVLENFTRIGPGENFWLQIIIEPTGSHWKEKGIELVKSVIANKKESHGGIINKIGDIPMMIAKELFHVWHWDFTAEESAAHEDPPGKVSDLTPGGRSNIEAVERKISKIGFKSKIRVIYLANHEVFNPSRCLDGFIGALSQFSIQSSNAIVPHSATNAHYFFKDQRINTLKHHFITAYKKRKIKMGANSYILNIEELATLWHFPMPFVKTPLLQKSGVKRSEPPINLPIETMQDPLKRKVKAVPTLSHDDVANASQVEVDLPPPPENLPFA
jgi:hypothetical protein